MLGTSWIRKYRSARGGGLVAAAADARYMIGPYTVADWLALPATVDGSRVELINGYLHVTPPPSTGHQRAAGRLARLLEDAIRSQGRSEWDVLQAVGVQISTAWRTALIPDLVVLDRKIDVAIVPTDALLLAVEVWSPGNTRAERETEKAAYAAAGVPFFWALTTDCLTAYRLVNGEYVVENELDTSAAGTITSAPVPVKLDLAELRP
jgi:Uma2 family endonuclease